MSSVNASRRPSPEIDTADSKTTVLPHTHHETMKVRGQVPNFHSEAPVNRYRAVIYDIDGTGLNTLNMNMYPLMRIIKEETGEDWAFEQVLRFAAYPGMKVMEELGVADPQGTYARWVHYVNEYEEGATLYEGFDRVFAALQERGVVQAVVSAKTRRQYELDMAAKGLDRYMAAAVLADDTDRHKPDPAPLLMCTDQLDIAPGDALYVGDARSDYEAARNAGMDFAYATWGSVSAEGIDSPTWTLDTPLDIVGAVCPDVSA